MSPICYILHKSGIAFTYIILISEDLQSVCQGYWYSISSVEAPPKLFF